uniref:Uncharacterized protein n=1 Tax=Ammonifex degensii TaxID=42838 RepID=A0A7C2EIW2_9THEO
MEEKLLQPQDVRHWAEGQERAEKIIAEERRCWLLQLDQETALRIYLGLASWPGARPDQNQPSPVLLAMRQAVSRLAEKQKR